MRFAALVLVLASSLGVLGFFVPLPPFGHIATKHTSSTQLAVGGKIFGEEEPAPPPQGQPGFVKPPVNKEGEEDETEGAAGGTGSGDKRKRRKRRKKYDFSDDLAAREEDEKRLAQELARKFPDIGRVKVDKFGNIIGGVNPFEGTDVKLEDQPRIDDEEDFPEVAGLVAGMDDPADAPWRLEAEKVVREQVQACGLTCYDILWTFHRLEVTVTRAEGDGPIEEAAYVDSDKLMQAIKGVNSALEEREEELFVLGRHELVVATPGAKDVLTTDRQFKAYKGFEIIVKAGGPFKNKRELRGKLLERTFDELMIIKDGRKVRIGARKVALLGSTGSIGTQTLDICKEKPQNFEVVSLAAGSNVDLLAEQIACFKPKLVSVATEDLVPALRERLSDMGVKGSDLPTITSGAEGIVAVACHDDADTVVTGIVGCAGLLPTVEAIKKKKTIALANKETLIAGGPAVLPLLKEYGVDMIPADSEHSALFQCLQGFPPDALRRIILTASGGAFRDWPVEDLAKVTVADALTHPNWDMGAKITVDSATMMNKGLEVIEAHYLFGADYDDIDIVVHPESIIHSMVEAQDTSVIAQLGWPDMRLPLLYSLSWPHRVRMSYDQLDLAKLSKLTFKEPDRIKYPCIDLAYAAGRKAGSMTAAMNAANERANEIFREEVITFVEIPQVIETVMEAHKADFTATPSIEDIVNVDLWARGKIDEAAAQKKLIGV
eukprot:g13394.t1